MDFDAGIAKRAKALLIRLADDAHVLVLAIDSLVAVAWSSSPTISPEVLANLLGVVVVVHIVSEIAAIALVALVVLLVVHAALGSLLVMNVGAVFPLADRLVNLAYSGETSCTRRSLFAHFLGPFLPLSE